MTENLHKKLTDVLSGAGIRPALSEDETNLLPYVTFELPVEYRYDKDGPYKIVGNLTIRAVSDDFDEADDLCGRICDALDEGFNGPAVEEELPVEIVDGEDPDTTEQPVTDGDPVEEPEPVEDDTEDPGEPVVDEPLDPIVDSGEEPANVEDAEHAEDAIDDSSYSARLTDIRKDCMDGIWVIELDYILNQYA